MHRKWLSPTPYHSLVIFLAMGIFGALFAWSSYRLFALAMASITLLEQYGSIALWDGGLRQLAEIIASGYLSLLFYLGFKLCENELVARWRGRRRAGED